MKAENPHLKRLAVSLLLVLIALTSALWLAKLAAAPEHHAESLAALDEKKVTVMELTAASAAASVAISAVPATPRRPSPTRSPSSAPTCCW